MPNLSAVTTLEEYAKAAGAVLIRKLKADFLKYAISLLPFSIGGPFAPMIMYLCGWIFDWIEKQAIFLAWCKYTDFRVAHQGSELGKAIYSEIQIKKNGSADEIKKAEEITDKLFDDFVIISH